MFGRDFICSLLLLAGSTLTLPLAAADDAEVPEEVVVRGSRADINLKLQVDHAEDAFYEVLNDLLDEEFHITCKYERVINSIIKERICQTKYMRDELSTAATLSLQGVDYMAAGILTEKNRQLRQKVIELLENNTELRNAARNLSDRVEEYRDEYGIPD